MSPLRRRTIEDMTIRKLAPKTQQGYIRTVKDFAAFLGRSPDTASVDGNERAGSPIRTIGEGHDHHSVATHGPFVAGAGR
jgi:Phage integrase, N-terminal SAM-like domain